MTMKRFTDKFIELAILSMILIIPVIFYTNTNDVFEINKMYVFRLFTIISVMMWVAKSVLDGKFTFVKSDFDVPVIGLFVVSLISTIITINMNVSLFGVYEDYEGIFTVLNYFLFYYLILNFAAKESIIFKIVTLIVIATIFVSIYGLAQNFGIDFVRWNPETYNPGRFFSTMGNPNFLAAYLVETIPVLFLLFFISKEGIRKLFILAVLLAATTVLFLTKSRAGFASFTVTVIFTVVYAVIDARKEKHGLLFKNRKWFIGFAVVFIAAAVMLPKMHEAFGDIWLRTSSIFKAGIMKTPRMHIWKSALMMFRDAPVFGKGLDSFQVMFPYYRTPDYWRIEWNGTPEKTHNIFLQYLATQGIAGFGFYLLLLAAFFKKTYNVVFAEKNIVRRYMAFAFFMLVIAYFIQGMFNYTVLAYGILFWFALAVILIFGGLDKGFYNMELGEGFRAFAKNNRVLILSVLGGFTLFASVLVTTYWASDMYFKIGCLISDSPPNEKMSLPYFEQAVKMNPYREIYWVKYGIAFEKVALAETNADYRKHFIDQAVEVHDYTLKLNSMNGYNYNNMARAYKFYGENIDRSKYQDSIKYYLEALKRDPHNAYFGLDLATVYINTGDFTKAAALCEQFMKDYPDFATPFSYMGYIYMLAAKQKAITKDKDTAGFLEKAKDYYTQAADPSKQWFRDYVSMSSTYSNLAIIYFNEGNKPRAIELFNRAITEWPQYKEGYYNLAVLYENGGDLKKAAQTYQQMLSVMPDDERAKSELEKLTKRGIK